MVVTRDGGMQVGDLSDVTIAVPGLRTSAYLALSLLLGQRVPHHEVVPFDQIVAKVVAGEFDAGLIIHEGQLTYGQAGLVCVVDLGEWWSQTHSLPLPLGGNAIRRDLGPQARPLCRILLNSIRYALDHRDDAVAYAMNYARDMGAELADRFVGMYVNRWTLDYGVEGREALQRFLSEAASAGLVPPCDQIDLGDPA
jgi:1,4-dihydroxy-6-naphthoate synthase